MRCPSSQSNRHTLGVQQAIEPAHKVPALLPRLRIACGLCAVALRVSTCAHTAPAPRPRSAVSVAQCYSGSQWQRRWSAHWASAFWVMQRAGVHTALLVAAGELKPCSVNACNRRQRRTLKAHQHLHLTQWCNSSPNVLALTNYSTHSPSALCALCAVSLLWGGNRV